MLSSKCKFVIKSEKLLHINVEYISHFQVAKDFLELACLHLSSDGVGLIKLLLQKMIETIKTVSVLLYRKK